MGKITKAETGTTTATTSSTTLRPARAINTAKHAIGITRQDSESAVQNGIVAIFPAIRRYSWPMRPLLISACQERNTRMANPTAPMKFPAQTTTQLRTSSNVEIFQ